MNKRDYILLGLSLILFYLTFAFVMGSFNPFAWMSWHRAVFVVLYFAFIGSVYKDPK